jgi:hypothetical protein
MNRNLFVILFAIAAHTVLGQSHQDVLRVSQAFNAGTARFVSMGGAFGALGADFTTLSYNPAGLGAYRSSEFTVTASLKNRIDNTFYQNQNITDSRSRFLFDNIGFVSSFKSIKEEEKGLVFYNIGIGYNRLADFNSETSTYGANSTNSIMNHFANQAQGFNWLDITLDDDNNPFKNSAAPWDAILAWNSFLIDTLLSNDVLYSRMLNNGDGVHQDQTLSSLGGIGEFTFSLASNFSNKLYIGGTLGIQDLYFKETQYYLEDAFDTNQPLPNGYLFENLDYQQTLIVEGTGVNFKLGTIYRPISNLRLGLAFHTPTFYSLNENFRASIKSVFDSFNISLSSPINSYDYKIKTPLKLIGSFAYTFGKKGLVGFDYEYIDFSSMQFGEGGDGYQFINENNEIKSIYTNTYNIKAGGEVWLNHLALRAGYALYGSPFKSEIPFASSAVNVLSAGFGLRIDNLFIDWAYQRYSFSDKYTLYLISPVVKREVLQNKFLFTLGYKF